MTEIWRVPVESCFAIEGYSNVFKTRSEEAQGGGICIYLRKPHTMAVRLDIPNTDIMESCCVEITANTNNKFLICGIYNKPSNKISNFLSDINKILMYITRSYDMPLICAGDLNINLLNMENYASKCCIDMFLGYGLQQFITSPTRVTTCTSTLIDHIYVSHNINVTNSGVIVASISDHDVAFIEIPSNNKTSKPLNKYVYRRNFRNVDWESLTANVGSDIAATFPNIKNTLDDNVILLESTITSNLDHFAPIKQVCVKRTFAPWYYNEDIKYIRRQRDAAKIKWRRNKENRNLRSEYKNLVRSHDQKFRSAKEQYFNQLITAGDSRKTWKFITNYAKKSDTCSTNISESHMLSYFTTTAERIGKKVAVPYADIMEYINSLPSISSNTLVFRSVSETEVTKIIERLKPNKADSDGITSNLLKLLKYKISPILCNIINTSFDMAIYPEQWKYSCLKAIPKTSKPDSIDDYRPIALQPMISKVIEKAVSFQLQEWILKQNHYPETLSGFRVGHSVESVLWGIRDFCQRQINDRRITFILMIDLSKAFDVVDHHKLIQKLYGINLHPSALRWFLSYLRGRKQFMSKDTNIRKPVNFGVPQGSILGPILFNIFSIDLRHNIPNDVTIFQYADDTQLLFSCKPNEINQTLDKIEHVLTILKNWTTNNGLFLNKSKTKIIVVASNVMHRKLLIPTNHSLSRYFTDEIRNLGFLMTKTLSPDKHIGEAVSASFRNLYILRRFIKDFRPRSKKFRKTLVEALVLSKIKFCMSLYCPLKTNTKRRLKKLMKSCCSLVLCKYVTSTDVKALGWMMPSEAQRASIISFARRLLVNKNSPSYIGISFATKNEDKDLRSSNAVTIKHTNLTGFGTLSFIAGKEINALPQSIRNKIEQKNFDTLVRQYLVSNSEA